MADELVGANILAGFQRFKGGVTAQLPEVRDATHMLGRQGLQVDVPTVNGQVPGEIADVSFWIDVRQLQLAPKEDLLCSRYHPGTDPDFEQLTAAVALAGEQVPALPVLPADREILLNGIAVPIFLVYDQPEIYYAVIGLKWARAKVYFPRIERPGAILLRAMGQHGQLRREPSMLEICLAAKRLKDTYGFTLREIAHMQARDPDDNTAPSTSQVHYQILVANLPPKAQDLLHHRHILWSHARRIAEFCGQDDVLCEQLATLVAQGGRMSIQATEFLIGRLRDGYSRLEMGEDGVAREISAGRRVEVGDSQATSIAQTTVFYQRMMLAPTAQVRQASKNFSVTLIGADNPERMALPPQALDSLRSWLSERRSAVLVRDVEAVLLGYLEAIRTAGIQRGIVGKRGEFLSLVDAVSSPIRASKRRV